MTALATSFEHRRADPDASRQAAARPAERAVDAVLADSFPASDPPSWTFGLARPPLERYLPADEPLAPASGRGAAPTAHPVEAERTGGAARTFMKGVSALAGAVAVVLAVPFLLLAIGGPIALLVRGVAEAAGWLLSFIL